MKLRITALIFSVVMLAVLLSGCGCEHDWAEATCLAPKTCNLCQETEGEAMGHTWAEASCAAPKTCTACGETEGEALPHTWVEANYQEPKTCSECGATEGEPLTADFEVHGLSCTLLGDANEQWIYPYVTSCYNDTSKKTTADLKVYNYRTFCYDDDDHPFKEGYEWRMVDVEMRFWDENYMRDGGYSWQSFLTDYYDIEGCGDSETDTEVEDGWYIEYAVNYQGKSYPCVSIIEDKGPRDGSYLGSIWPLRWYFQVPIGYDGTVIGFYDASIEWEDKDGKYVYDIADENTLFFRLD